MIKYRLKKKGKKEFKVTCEYCGYKDCATKFYWRGWEQECDMCGSHSGVDLTCPKCDLKVEVYGI